MNLTLSRTSLETYFPSRSHSIETVLLVRLRQFHPIRSYYIKKRTSPKSRFLDKSKASSVLVLLIQQNTPSKKMWLMTIETWPLLSTRTLLGRLILLTNPNSSGCNQLKFKTSKVTPSLEKMMTLREPLTKAYMRGVLPQPYILIQAIITLSLPPAKIFKALILDSSLINATVSIKPVTWIAP